MSTDDIKFYNLLDPGRRRDAIDFLVHNQTLIVMKLGAHHFKTKILSQSNSEFRVYKFNFENFDNASAICTFEINAEKYFFTSEFTSNDSKTVLKIPTKLYQLQRRNDFRINIPMSMNYTCQISSINSRPVKFVSDIRDLSLGGCQLVVKRPDFDINRGDELLFLLKIAEFDREIIFCEVKHILELQLDSKIQIGVHFSNADAEFLRDMQTLLVKLDRIHRGKTYE